MDHELRRIDWPEFGGGGRPADPGPEEYSRRLERLRIRTGERGLTHLLVYGDREHFANLAYLTGYDPRFEEAILILGREDRPLLVVGNEGEGYLDASPLHRTGELRTERYQSFSLLDQPRGESRSLNEILADEQIGDGSRVGCVGWKYFSKIEMPDSAHALEIPAYLVDALRNRVGPKGITNATDLLMSPRDGLRSVCGIDDILYFEYTNVLASEGIRRLLHGLREGMTDLAAATLVGYNGEPLGCHMTLVTGETRDKALTSPRGATIGRGDPLAVNLCYWGSNTCRAGWVAESEKDLPEESRDYVEAFAGPYLEAMNAWFGELHIGVVGDRLYRAIHDRLADDVFGVYLNPGHLIHLDEWLSSPIYRGSSLPLRSGMVLQSDVIPTSSRYFSSRMEDGLVLADQGLQDQIASAAPEMLNRCKSRRRFMREEIGLNVSDEVLPLSNMSGIVPPFFLDPDRLSDQTMTRRTRAAEQENTGGGM